jgi:hypothetical protein
MKLLIKLINALFGSKCDDANLAKFTVNLKNTINDYFVSTVGSNVYGYETAVFRTNPDGTVDYSESIFTKTYRDSVKACCGHLYYCRECNRLFGREFV